MTDSMPRTGDELESKLGQVNETQHGGGPNAYTDMDQSRTVDYSKTQDHVAEQEYGVGTGPQVLSTSGELEVICGPLLNYRRMGDAFGEQPTWYGSVLLCTLPGQRPPNLRLSCVGAVGGSGMANGYSGSRDSTFQPVRLFEDPWKGFWRYEISLPFQNFEATWEYIVPNMRAKGGRPNLEKPKRFSVPSKHESMRIMFHSCNGFSVGTDEDAWQGPALWNDVLRMHAKQPFHVMIGGGDQIYNDSVRVDGPLKPWTDIGNPHKRREFPFNEDMRRQCDEYYFNNYTKWYNLEPFSSANGQIPQLNIWDDHDIIDGK